jgi:hypothetical protein
MTFLRFRLVSAVLTHDRPPVLLRVGFILSFASRLFKVRGQTGPVDTPIRANPDNNTNMPPMGFRSQSRHTHQESTNNRPSTACLTFHPQCFSHSRRLTPPGNVQAYFILLPLTGFAFQGFSPLPSCTVSSTATPLMTLSNALLLPELPRTVQIPLPRLQGLVPNSDPLPPTGGLVLPTPRSPLKFSLLRACLRTPWRHLRASSAHDLYRRFLTVTSTLAFSVSSACDLLVYP